MKHLAICAAMLASSVAHAGSYLLICQPDNPTTWQRADKCEVWAYDFKTLNLVRSALVNPDMGSWSRDEYGNLIFWIKGDKNAVVSAVGLMVSDDTHE